MIFLDQCHSSEMLLIASPHSVTAAIGSCSLPWHVFICNTRFLPYFIFHIADHELWADFIKGS